MRSKFQLSKWYLDCISDEGDVFIGYSAKLRWRSFSINYAGSLQLIGDQPVNAATWLDSSPPVLKADTITWNCERLGLNGCWNADAPSIERRLLETSSGSIDWHCIQPRSRVAVGTDGGRALSGLGYAEHMEMSIPPWKLPIDELRWGRFLSNSDSLVWIDWRGAIPLTLLFHNNCLTESPQVTDEQIGFPNNRLNIRDHRILREGPLIKTALLGFPPIRRMLPQRGLDTYECKWRGWASLKSDDRIVSEGWTINEIVRFG